MASAGEDFRKYYTADFYNRLIGLLGRSQRSTGSGRVVVSNTRDGSQIVVPKDRSAVSTIQGVLTGGSTPAVADGTEILDPYAFAAYSIQAAYFVLSAGTTTLSVQINGTPVTWLDSLAISTVPTVIFIANPVPDLTHVMTVGSQLSIVLSGSSGTSAGLSFSLNTPF